MPHLSLNSPLGPLTVFEDRGAVVAVEWGRAGTPDPSSPSPLLEEARRQLDAYFDGRLKAFDLPLHPAGSAFRRAVWGQMLRIPYGRTRTYGDIADALMSAPRAVGGACAANPIPIIVPCHRVVSADGRMIGYSGGQGIETKIQLLKLEGYLVA
ncbi:MAG: cysteine methyltransferase [Rhodospirillaceae bacterium]|jgi:methylated-DNA-[protein]-cysteine S-methyltransferase|nr:cysteine methyltransferase [Rhodospirillaceae bacterium]|tara:strand:+ start:565 stop:1026 length:462 start_codon:yes stop_codon:yes gene_type:complete